MTKKYKSNSSKSPKPYRIIILVILSILIITLLILELTHKINLVRFGKEKTTSVNPTTETINYIPTSEEEQKQIDDAKTNPEAIPEKVENPSPIAPSVTITEAKQENAQVIVKTELDGNGWKSCKLLIYQGSESFSRNAEVIFQEEFSTCAGFSIPVTDFSNSGAWTFSLSAIKSDGSSSKSESVNVSVIK